MTNWRCVGSRDVLIIGDANTANKSDNQTIHAENKIFNFCENWAVTDNTTNKGSRPEIQDDPWRGGEKGESTIFNTTNNELCSMSTSNFCRDKFPQRDDIVGKRNHRRQEEEGSRKPDQGIV